MQTLSAQIGELSMEIDIDAPAAAVWQALTANIDDWWPADFYAGGEDGKRRFMLEPAPGGRMQEAWDGGGGVVWGTVIGVDPGARLEVAGLSFPSWGGPAQWFGTWTLTEQDGKTRLRFSEHSIGRVSKESTAEKDKGWRFLWETMQANIENRPAPSWSD